ncbi:hypothetical protein D3C81_1975330 [compost metagenome]
MISAPRVMRSRLMPISIITRKVRPRVSGTAMPTISPARRPMANMLTATTTATATRNLTWNRLTAPLMASAWLVSTSSAMPSGRRWRSASRKAASRSPSSRPFSPLAMTTPSSSASCPRERTR